MWTTLTTHEDTGGAPVTSYSLEWDAGSAQATWTSLVGFTYSFLETEYIVTTGVTPGQEYYFRVLAYNAHGWSTPSPVKMIAATAEPDQMETPTTSVQTGGIIRVAWTTANDNSDALTAYDV